MKMFYIKYYLLESGEILQKAQQFRSDFISKRKEILEYVKTLGGIGYVLGACDGLSAIQFQEHNIPKGFKKPGKNGCSYPAAKSKFIDEFKRYKLPKSDDVFCDYIGCPETLSFTADNMSGQCTIGHPLRTIGIYWYSETGPILMTVPDVKKYANDIITEGLKNLVFEGDSQSWAMDKPGAKEILKEEWDFMVAKYKQDAINGGLA